MFTNWHVDKMSSGKIAIGCETVVEDFIGNLDSEGFESSCHYSVRESGKLAK
jgi:hypothetical protein